MVTPLSRSPENHIYKYYIYNILYIIYILKLIYNMHLVYI